MVLVTGSTGLVGSHLLLHLLENGEKVRAMYRNEKGITKTKSLFLLYKKDHLFEKIEWIQADINDIPSLEIAFKDIAFVYHCAALISFEPKKENALRKINIEGTANVVNFCLEYKVKKLCHVSSIAALGDLLPHESVITEKTEWNPEKNHSNYAITKYGGEMEIWRGQQEGLKAIIVNPGVILGPVPNHPDWLHGSAKIFSTVAKGISYYTKGVTGFVAVDDVVKIMYALMNKEIEGKRYIIVAENIDYYTLTHKISKSLNVKPPTIYAKKWITELVWKLDWLYANLFFTKRKMPKAIAKSLHTEDFYSNEKVKKELDYKFQSIDKCIETSAKYFLNP